MIHFDHVNRCMVCDTCGDLHEIRRRSPESIAIAADNYRRSHRCPTSPAVSTPAPEDRWLQLFANIKF